MPNLEVYSKEWCPYCAKAKALLKSKGLSYQEINVTSDETLQQRQREEAAECAAGSDRAGEGAAAV